MHNFHQTAAHKYPPFRRQAAAMAGLLALIAFGSLLSGCMQRKGDMTTVQEPPYIPALPDMSKYQNDAAHTSSLPDGFYKDLLDDEAAKAYHPNLKEAITQAIRLGILKPNGFQEKFNPGQAISYGEIRQWVQGYQTRFESEGAPGASQPTPTPTPTPTDDKTDQPNLTASSHFPKATPRSVVPVALPETLAWGNHALSEDTFMTREDACALYATLTQQDAKARNMGISAASKSEPGGQEADNSETLNQIHDYASISPWALRYVALAYHDNMLENVLQLSPNRLLLDEGLQPQKAFTRGDAIVLLNSLYGEAASHIATETSTPLKKPDDNPATASPPAPATTAKPITTMQAVSRPVAMKAKPTPPKQSVSPVLPRPMHSTVNVPGDRTNTPPAKSVEQPLPLKSIQKIQESGPNGTRQSIQMNGSD